MISAIELRNFKNLRHQQIELDRLTVFVGANASGKTSVLEALHLGMRAVSSRLETPAGSPNKVFRNAQHCDWLYTRGGTGDLSIACTTPEGTFAMSATPPEGFSPSEMEKLGQGRWTFQVSPTDETSLKQTFSQARPTVFLHLNATRLASPAYSARTPPQIGSDGNGLAAVLAYMALNDPDGFEQLVDELRQLIPQLKRIRFTKKPIQRTETELVRFGKETVERKSKREYQADAILFDFQNANNVSAHTVSEGTLLLLGLLTVLLGPTRPNILLLDDIEHGLHPLAQKTLLNFIKNIMGRFPDLQILATAHSPYLLDELQPEQVRQMATDAEGYAVCGRLTDHPQFETWKQEMAPGELWSLFGEKWVAEGVRATCNNSLLNCP